MPVQTTDESKAFRWKTRQSQCVVPGSVIHDGVAQDSVKPVSCEEAEGHWIWTEAGQLVWSEGCQKCVQSHKFNTPVHMHFCEVREQYYLRTFLIIVIFRTTQRIRMWSLVSGRSRLAEEKQN